MRPRYFFAAGPGNVILAHKNWIDGIDDPGQMSITFSSEFEAFCRDNKATSYIVSSASPPETYKDETATIEHRPKRAASGLKYHLVDVFYGLCLVATAVQFKADYAFLQSGSTHYFVMVLFRLFGVKVVPILHNTLWPSGFPPTSIVSRAILFLDSLFFRWSATAILCVSPECSRQVDEITTGHHGPMEIFTIQFNRNLYEPIDPPPMAPFKLLFAGRIAANKGVFDLLKIMQIAEAKCPGCATLEICGDGPDLLELRNQSSKLDNITIHGWTAPADLRRLISESHASIIPTRSGFAEGMAMTVIEPILLGRPVITNSVVPALEVLRGACIEAQTDNPESYAAAIISLMQDLSLYDRLRKSCATLREQFFDRDRSSQSALRRITRPSPRTSDRCRSTTEAGCDGSHP